MGKIVTFERRSPSPERIAAAISAASSDRVLALVARERHWQALAHAAREQQGADEVQRFEMRAEALFDEITRTKPTTIEGAIAQLRLLFGEQSDWVETIAAGLEEIAAEFRRR